ncbi:50S ribosomal protein L24 [Candidatus Woesearchaeota archaeon]|jgi:large subunit ribosomal protein L24|nr:50S ribosomal protein L24 [Candidatus Woesearchaeota archaeon]
MNKEFSKHWKKSKQPRKKRKYAANAPLHIKRKMLSSNLSKDLRKKYSKRSLVIKKGDVAKIMRGKFKNKQGKVINVDIKRCKVTIEGITITKVDGSKVPVKMHPSNLQIIELNLDDKKRIKEKNNQEEKK